MRVRTLTRVARAMDSRTSPPIGELQAGLSAFRMGLYRIAA
ncbi:hypothetical protein M2159_008425 [Streptomyces sp. SAI-090]|jgi:hypothetical protein|nr:hypothetical protein [Streptomyces sp. SAI-090]